MAVRFADSRAEGVAEKPQALDWGIGLLKSNPRLPPLDNYRADLELLIKRIKRLKYLKEYPGAIIIIFVDLLLREFIRNSSVIEKGFFLMVSGVLFVFAVQVIFYLTIKL